MTSWRDEILRGFIPHVFRLTIAADPDALLLDESVLQQLHDRDFDLIPFDDHLAFRSTYESEYRSRWDRGEETACTVILRSDREDLDSLPNDLLRAGYRLHFSLADLFPKLSYSVVRALDRADIDALHAARGNSGSEMLGDNETKDFVLRHVYKIAPELITTPGDLLEALLERHHGNHRISAILDDRLIHVLHASGKFQDWPLGRIVPHRDAFLQFLQERWPLFLDQKLATLMRALKETPLEYAFQLAGPAHLPLDDVRAHIDTLFLDRELQPIEHEHGDILASHWVSVGVRIDPDADKIRRANVLLTVLENELPGSDEAYRNWLAYGRRWGELVALRYGPDWPNEAPILDRLNTLQHRTDRAFEEWVLRRYGGLYNQYGAMVHQVPRIIRRHREESGRKVALVVVDGLSFGQWVVVREYLKERSPDFVFDEGALFSWVPTITSVSRQAIFAGEPPRSFPSSITTTAKEEALWRQSWNGSLPASEIAYAKGLGDEGSADLLGDSVLLPKTRVAGLVVDTVDKILHGSELGAAGVYEQIQLWCEQGVPGKIFDLLLDRGYDVFLTSDHGNVEAMGIGRPEKEGVMADLRGERARIYQTESLRGIVASQFPKSILWPPANGLPADFWPLLAPDRHAFAQEGRRSVTHGGICIEELIVPFVHIQRLGA